MVKTQNGDVTVKLTGDTSYEISSKGAATDLKAGEQVVVSGETADGTLTARTVRQGDGPRPEDCAGEIRIPPRRRAENSLLREPGRIGSAPGLVREPGLVPGR